MSTIDTSQAESENGFSSFMDVLCRFDKPLVAADDEPAIEEGGAADDEPAIEEGESP
jgi:hypothetical protein